MSTQTYSFTVQLYEDGRMSYHSWQAKYAPGGRQLPSHRAGGDVPDMSYLAYVASEMVDEVGRERARRTQERASETLI